MEKDIGIILFIFLVSLIAAMITICHTGNFTLGMVVAFATTILLSILGYQIESRIDRKSRNSGAA